MDIRLINSTIEWKAFIPQLLDSNEIGFDVETRGLYGDILTVGLSPVYRTAVVVPIFHKDSLLDGREVLQTLREIILHSGKHIVGHNLSYDLVCLAQQTEGSPVWDLKACDSMAYHFMLDENVQDRKLSTLVEEFTDIEQYKDSVDIENLAETSLEDIAEYNGLDAIAPMVAGRSIRHALYDSGYGSDLLEKLFMKIIPFTSAMQFNGLKIDEDVLDEEEDKERENNAKCLEAAKEFAPEVNLNSPKQLAKLIYEDFGCSVPDIKGAMGVSHPSTAEKIIQRIRPKHPFVEALLDYRKSTRQLSHYFEKTRECMDSSGFVHPEYYVIKSAFGGTVSGRLSAKNPAVQTFSKSPVRRAYVSRNPGGVLIGIDGAQMELRYAAQLSGDEALLNTFRSGQDPHQATADLVETSRHIGKTINFAGIYGVTAKGLHENAGLSMSLAKDVVGRLKEAWSGLYDFLDKVRFFLIHNQRINTPYGRWRRLDGASIYDGIGRYKLREGANFIVQSVASDIVQLLGWHLWQQGLMPVLSNHDGLMFDVRPQDVEEALDKMRQGVLYLPKLIKGGLNIDLEVPYVFDVKIGENWLEVEKETYRRFSTNGS